MKKIIVFVLGVVVGAFIFGGQRDQESDARISLMGVGGPFHDVHPKTVVEKLVELYCSTGSPEVLEGTIRQLYEYQVEPPNCRKDFP